jgi:hypothetical protein
MKRFEWANGHTITVAKLGNDTYCIRFFEECGGFDRELFNEIGNADYLEDEYGITRDMLD